MPGRLRAASQRAVRARRSHHVANAARPVAEKQEKTASAWLVLATTCAQRTMLTSTARRRASLMSLVSPRKPRNLTRSSRRTHRV
jgi:hypothetical protein